MRETAKTLRVDDTDRRLLRVLQEDGRISNTDLLVQPVGEEGGYPGRALSGYRRALEWILSGDEQPMEQAA